MEDTITILYVEDNPENRLLVRRILMAEGFDVAEAESASKAVEFINTRYPDLILMDINMPEVDGYTLTSRLRENPRLNGVPIIALTANVMKGDRERTLEAGCDGYIQKPIDVDMLPQQILRFLKEVGRV
ncbi:MAG: two-component system response regulator [Chloroflexi bacterium RBG_19FT_COMBO_47_9]|jgi:two-component system cell cycle response regulator DivK|nr:MAG: two-component system response regulator [Chloroflexi bacterium RBG_19FT_COMBO_47_9]